MPMVQPKTRGRQLAPQLVRMIEGEMVPRLLLVRHPASVPTPAPTESAADSPFSAGHIEELVRLLLTHEALQALHIARQGCWPGHVPL